MQESARESLHRKSLEKSPKCAAVIYCLCSCSTPCPHRGWSWLLGTDRAEGTHISLYCQAEQMRTVVTSTTQVESSEVICPGSCREGCDRARSERINCLRSHSSTGHGPTPVQRGGTKSPFIIGVTRPSGRCRTRPLWGQAPAIHGCNQMTKVPHVAVTKLVPSKSHPKLTKKQSVIPAYKSDASSEKKCLSAAWQTMRAESDRLKTHRPPTTRGWPTAPTHAPSRLIFGTAAPTGGKGPPPGCLSLAAQPSGD